MSILTNVEAMVIYVKMSSLRDSLNLVVFHGFYSCLGCVYPFGALIVGAMYATAKTKVEKLLFFDNQHNNVFALDFIPSRISSLWRRC